jgi:hypothetical protein
VDQLGQPNHKAISIAVTRSGKDKSLLCFIATGSVSINLKSGTSTAPLQSHPLRGPVTSVVTAGVVGPTWIRLHAVKRVGGHVGCHFYNLGLTRARKMKSISIFVLTAIACCPLLFSSCASTGATNPITATSNVRGTSLASKATYNAATMQFQDAWPFGPNTYH